ncbi:MAG: hypothetical protein ACYDAO_04480 [Thermoplasmataceae archaeon]
MGDLTETKLITISNPVIPASGTLIYQTVFHTVDQAVGVGVSGVAVDSNPYHVDVVGKALDIGNTNEIAIVVFEISGGTLTSFTGTLAGNVNIIAVGI